MNALNRVSGIFLGLLRKLGIWLGGHSIEHRSAPSRFVRGKSLLIVAGFLGLLLWAALNRRHIPNLEQRGPARISDMRVQITR